MPELSPNLSSNPDSGDDSSLGSARVSARGTPPPTPRWVKASGIIVAVLVGLFVILHLTGNSPVGMGGHAPLLQHWVQLP